MGRKLEAWYGEEGGAVLERKRAEYCRETLFRRFAPFADCVSAWSKVEAELLLEKQ